MKIKQYLFNVLVAADQLVNTICGGYPDETVSSRVYRASECEHKCAKVVQWILNGIFLPFETEHCRKAYESELNRAQNFPLNKRR